MTRRWRHRPPGSNWGDFGPDDEIGRVNLLTETKVLEGIAEVKAGKRFCLSLPLDYPGGNAVNPKRSPPQLRPTLHEDKNPYYNLVWGTYRPGFTDVSSDDVVLLHTQYSTQWDSLAHAGALFDADGDGVAEIVYYNGWRGHVDVRGPTDAKDDSCCEGSVQASRLGIENLAEACLQGRGVLVDLHAHLGDGRTEVGYDTLMRILEADRIEISSGDMLLLHTGWARLLLNMGKRPDAEKLHASSAVLDAHDDRLLQWITDVGVAALVADNFAVEDARKRLAPEYRGPRLPLHHLCLFKLGVPLGELWYLSELAGWLRANRRSRFLLTAPPLRLPGAVGSPTTPIATV